MKKLILPLVVGSVLLTGCTNGNADDSTMETTVSSELAEPEKKKLDIGRPDISLEDETFILNGTADPTAAITISIEEETLKTFSPDEDGTFEFSDELPQVDDVTYTITDGDTTQNVKIKSIETLTSEEEQRQKAAEERAAEAERKKAEEEAAKEEERKKDEEQAKEDEELVKRVQAIQNATREEHNALSKAEDYLSFTAFSKSGLKDQLVYEGFPDDTAQFAVDHIKVDWNEQALKKAKQYLEFSSFSDQGLYDQLIYEGFTPDQAQYAIDNLPD